MMKFLRIFILSFAFMFFNCCASEIDNSNYDQLEKTAKEKFKTDYKITLITKIKLMQSA